MMDERGLALGIDIGGSKVAAVLLDDRGTVLGHERGPVAPESNEAGLASVFDVVDRLLASLPAAGARVKGIGAGAPGTIDWRDGVLRGASNLNWKDLPLAEALRERYGVAALLDNDVNAAAWGERCFGAGAARRASSEFGSRDGSARNDGRVSADTEHSRPTENHRSGPELAQHLVFITVGTGIGGGLVESGRIVRGRRAAGEIGHIPLLEDGPQCRCGSRGCLEAVASGPAFGLAGASQAAAGLAPRLYDLAAGNAAAVTPSLIVRAAVEGDAGARRVLEREAYYLAVAVLVAMRMLDPEVVAIGGGLSGAGEPLFGALRQHLRRMWPRGGEPGRYMRPARLGSQAGAIGGAALVLRPEPGFVGAGLLAAS
jgi:glucokinase